MKTYISLILLIFLLAGCRSGSFVLEENTESKDKTLTVSAAVSLKDAFNEIGEIYKSKTGNTVNFNFGASGALQKQIETGAPVDVFASAGEQQMNALVEKGLIDTKNRQDFARNTLVLIVPANSKLALASFSDLDKSEVQKIAVGNPKTVPAGQYTEQVFEKANLKNVLQSKLIYAEDVRQVLDYVVRGETDAGIVYATDARIAGEKVRVAAIASENTHAPILYPIASIKESRAQTAAKEFTEIVLSSEGRSILQKYGFASPTEK